MLRYSFGQFVEVSKPNTYLSVYRGFLEIYQKKALLGKVSLDDILALIITAHSCSHTSNILTALSDRGIPVSICGSNFMPKAIVLPLVGNSRQSVRIRSQVGMSQPLRKNLWKQIVQSKLKNQASVLKEYQLPYEALFRMSYSVKSGDPENIEAWGARRYWTTLFSKDFRRDTEEGGANAMLNYAYAIIRSCVARGVVAAGLHPSISFHHKNTYNPMCLVDDLMEPFRPLGDYIVKKLLIRRYSDVNKEVKEILSKIAVANISFGIDNSPLFYVVARLSSSLAMVLSKERKKWELDKVAFNWKLLNNSMLNHNVEKVSSSA